MNRLLFVLITVGLLNGCGGKLANEASADYFDNSGRADALSGGVRLIPIETPAGTFRVWTKRAGDNPTIKVLLLHGASGATHEYLEADVYIPMQGPSEFLQDVDDGRP